MNWRLPWAWKEERRWGPAPASWEPGHVLLGALSGRERVVRHPLAKEVEADRQSCGERDLGAGNLWGWKVGCEEGGLTPSFRASDSPRASLFLARGSQPLPLGDRFNYPRLSLWRLVLQERSFTPETFIDPDTNKK